MSCPSAQAWPFESSAFAAFRELQVSRRPEPGGLVSREFIGSGPGSSAFGSLVSRDYAPGSSALPDSRDTRSSVLGCRVPGMSRVSTRVPGCPVALLPGPQVWLSALSCQECRGGEGPSVAKSSSVARCWTFLLKAYQDYILGAEDAVAREPRLGSRELTFTYLYPGYPGGQNAKHPCLRHSRNATNQHGGGTPGIPGVPFVTSTHTGRGKHED